MMPSSSNTSSQLSINPSRQVHNSSQGPMAILWDIENCPVPSNVRPEEVAGNIRMALRVHPVIDAAVTIFSAYGDFNAFPRRLREGCQRTGVKLIDVPNGRKDAADKAILVDMFLFALDNPPPSSIMLISGDVDFAPALHVLGQRGYTVILVIPSGVSVSSALSSAGRFVWDWPSVSRGEGFVPPAKATVKRISEKEEESIIYSGVSKNFYNTRNFSKESYSQSEFGNGFILRAQNPTTSRAYSVSSSLSEQDDVTQVQPGDLNGLKGQMVKLLESLGGSLPLTCLPTEYQKIYGRPLYVSEYGAIKLVNLLKKMDSEIVVKGKGQKRVVSLRNSKPIPICSPVILARRDNNNNGKEAKVDGVGSSDEFSDEERVVLGESVLKKSNCQMSDRNLEKFRYELQDIVVSFSCGIFLDEFDAVYQQRYRRQLDYVSLGVSDLEELLGKMRDVVMLQEEGGTERKFLIAVDG